VDRSRQQLDSFTCHFVSPAALFNKTPETVKSVGSSLQSKVEVVLLEQFMHRLRESFYFLRIERVQSAKSLGSIASRNHDFAFL
jgi:hypothetical protein